MILGPVPTGGPLATGKAWKFWTAGTVIRTVEHLEPRLASWNVRTHPDQVRLHAYLDRLAAAVGDLPTGTARLFLHMDIDVLDAARLLRHHDLENYLTPVVHRLGHARFALVSGSKQVGGGSRVVVGLAEPLAHLPVRHTWGQFACRAGSGTQEKRWKAGLREALRASQPTPLPPGPVEVHLAWRCSPARNWVWLWKPTGDAMGPVLGEPDPRNPFNPQDDRIVALGLHLNADPAAGHEVDVAMSWRPAADATGGPERGNVDTDYGLPPAHADFVRKVVRLGGTVDWFVASALLDSSPHEAQRFVAELYNMPFTGEVHMMSEGVLILLPEKGGAYPAT